MNVFTALARKMCLSLAVIIVVLSTGNVVAASEGAGSWRPTYDAVMLWVNFIILVAVFIKFGKEPLKNFVMEKRSDVANEIETLEKQRDEVKSMAEETMQSLETSKSHFQEISDRIIEAGEKAKQSIIEDAKQQSHSMIEDTQRKIENLLMSAKQDFRSELIDASVDLALKKIVTHVTPEDDKRLIEQYLMAVPKNTPV